MTKAQEAQITALENEIKALKLERKHTTALIEGEERRRHSNLETIPVVVREKSDIVWEELILLFKEGLNQIDQELQRKSMDLILLRENIRRESGHGSK